MITEEQRKFNTQRIVELLESTNRPGIELLIIWLAEKGYFNSPASTKYHGNYPGGLAEHSLNVFNYFTHLNNLLSLETPKDSIILAALLHDICKVGAYIGDSVQYQYNKAQPAGHAELSITRANQYIHLSELETSLIRHHMGPYAHSADELKAAWDRHPAAKFLYFADEISAQLEKARP
jgi:23S rRNA maturation-related 3'-5' exoribonuclease YhaM